MGQSKTTYVVVGAFVLIMLAGLIGLLMVLAGRTGATHAYLTPYTNVAGLKFGTPVFFEGFRAGQVEAIEPDNPVGREASATRQKAR